MTLGNEQIIYVEVEGRMLACRRDSHFGVRPGDAHRLVGDADKLHVFDPKTGRNISAATKP